MESTFSEFIKLVSGYCLLLENNGSYDLEQFTKQCEVFLAKIYHAVPNLPEIHKELQSNIKIEDDSGQRILRNLREKLKKRDRYVVWSDWGDPLFGLFSDDLTTIYNYLKTGLLMSNTDLDLALGYWQSNFAAQRFVIWCTWAGLKEFQI